MKKSLFVACLGFALVVACTKDEPQKNPETPVVQEITLSETSEVQLTTNESKTLTISGGDGKTFEVTSSKPAVAEVSVKDKTITITPKSKGETTLTITSGGKTKTLKVVVNNSEKNNPENTEKPNTPTNALITKITFDSNQGKIPLGKSFKLTPTIEPSDAKNKTLKWESSDTNIAKVDQEGNVFIAKFAGRPVTITATAQDGSNIKGIIDVVGIQAVTSIEITWGDKKELSVGTKTKLEVNVVPASASASVRWKSSNPDVVSIDDNGNLETLKIGKSTLTVEALDGSATSDSIEIVVISTAMFLSVNESDEDEEITLKATEKKKLSVSLYADEDSEDSIMIIDEKSPYKNLLQWTSNDKTIAEVKNMELVTYKAGTTTITVIFNDGRETPIEEQITINVEPNSKN